MQDEGSQLLGMLVDAPPTRVVDACAGAGGKTLQLAVQMKNRGDLHALDVDERPHGRAAQARPPGRASTTCAPSSSPPRAPPRTRPSLR